MMRPDYPDYPDYLEHIWKSASSYVYSFYGSRYAYFISQEARDDAFAACRAAVIEGWLMGIDGKASNGRDHLYIIGVRACKNWWYHWLKGYLTDFPFAGKEFFSGEPERKPISLLAIARVVYQGLLKKGARGRRSAAMKAFVIREIIEGDLGIRNADPRTNTNQPHRWNRSRDHIISLRSQTLNRHHWMSDHSAKKHYQSATAVLFGISRGNITR